MYKNKFKYIICMVILLSVILLDTNPKVLAASETKAEYTMKKDKEIYKDKAGKIRGVVYFQYPEIIGESEAAKKINELLKSESEAYMQSETAQNLKDYTEGAIKSNSFYTAEDQYYYKTICRVTYNNNSIISLHMKECWYAGGVYNQTDYGYTFDLKSGAVLGIKDLVSGDAASIKNKILAAGKKYLTSDSDFDQNAYNAIKSYKLKDYKFYLSKGKIYICFGSYELGRGTGWDIFTIKSKY